MKVGGSGRSVADVGPATHADVMLLVDVTRRALGWITAAWALIALTRGQEAAAGLLTFIAVTLIPTGRDLRYRRLARRADRWAAEAIEIAHRRSIDP